MWGSTECVCQSIRSNPSSLRKAVGLNLPAMNRAGVALSDHKRLSVLSVISDLVLAALPIIFLRNLQIGLRTKIGLCLLMALGVLYVG